MEIIKRGKIEKVAKIKGYEIQCATCETVFQCRHDEVEQEVVGHGMMGKVVTCPVCGHRIHDCYGIGAGYWKTLYTEGRRPYADEVEYL